MPAVSLVILKLGGMPLKWHSWEIRQTVALMYYSQIFMHPKCDRTVQFIQDQVRLSPLNTLTRAYSHLYKPGSPPSVRKTSVNQHHNQDRVIKQIHITYAELQRK